MSDTWMRHWTMLRLVPRLPRKIDTTTLVAQLEERGFVVTLRSVQRDLVKLSRFLPIVEDERRPAGWAWEKSAEDFAVPVMDPHTAIAFRLVEQQLSHQLPRATLATLKPHFKTAQNVLAELPRSGLPRWGDKVRAVPRAQALIAPRVPPSVLTAVYDALLSEQQIDVQYRGRTGKESAGVVNPLALVFRDALPVLVATWAHTPDATRQLLLPRLLQARLLPEKRQVPADFRLDAYLASGEMSFRLGKDPIKLRARFHPDAAPSVVETPLAQDQVVDVDKAGWSVVHATVEDTRVLRGWLLSFGELVDVMGPPALRRSIAQHCAAAARHYGREETAKTSGQT